MSFQPALREQTIRPAGANRITTIRLIYPEGLIMISWQWRWRGPQAFGDCRRPSIL